MWAPLLPPKSGQGLKLDALSLLHTILETHSPKVLHTYMAELVPLVTSCADDDWYKIIAQVSRLCDPPGLPS